MRAFPVILRDANAYVASHHRHSQPVRGHKFSIGAMTDEGDVAGVAIIGRPVSRVLDDGWTVEVLRVCTVGHRNACSFLYGASWRAAKAMGYLRAVTYTRDDELAASVRAAGWIAEGGRAEARSWDTPSRRRDSGHTPSGLVRWEVRSAAWKDDLEPRPTLEPALSLSDQLSL